MVGRDVYPTSKSSSPGRGKSPLASKVTGPSCYKGGTDEETGSSATKDHGQWRTLGDTGTD